MGEPIKQKRTSLDVLYQRDVNHDLKVHHRLNPRYFYFTGSAHRCSYVTETYFFRLHL